MKLAVILIVICSVVHFSSAHFSLTYPIARYPDYDFLDNIRTGGPCGVPNGTVTSCGSLACCFIQHKYIQLDGGGGIS